MVMNTAELPKIMHVNWCVSLRTISKLRKPTTKAVLRDARN